MTVQTLRIQNPNAFLLPELEDLVKRAYAQHSFMGDAAAAKELRDAVQHESNAVFVARKDDKYVGLIHVIVPEGGNVDAASVPHLYCQKMPEARHALLTAMVGFVRDKGYTRIITVDANRKPRSFSRLFEKVGKAREVGRVYEFDITESKYVEPIRERKGPSLRDSRQSA